MTEEEEEEDGRKTSCLILDAMPEAGVPPAMRSQPKEDRRPREDGSLENYVTKRLSSAYVIAVLRMPGAQAAPRDILLAPRTCRNWKKGGS